mgnify:FL=1|jgi:hypothetical protein
MKKIIRKYLGPPKLIAFFALFIISCGAIIENTKQKVKEKNPCDFTLEEIYYIESDAREIIDVIETHRPLDSLSIRIIKQRANLILETVK